MKSKSFLAKIIGIHEKRCLNFCLESSIDESLSHGRQVFGFEVGCVAHIPGAPQSLVFVCASAVEGKEVDLMNLWYSRKQVDDGVDFFLAVVDSWDNGYACDDMSTGFCDTTEVIDDGGVGGAYIVFEGRFLGRLHIVEEGVGVLAYLVEQRGVDCAGSIHTGVDVLGFASSEAF